jgi:serine/threonine protein kinase
MQPDLIGGRYRVERAIGQGGMGTVWLCRDETLHREVAVKQVGLLPGESVTDSARAFREARSSAALSHRNVVTVFDVVEESGAIWLVMEHVPGRSLAEIIKEDGPLDPAVVADLGAQVADGLAAAHAAGTMHRDVKPGNVLVREDGVAKISDFGIARSAGDPALTQSGFLTGTPSYFSPELARGSDPGPGTDVWALGATLYAAVEGRPPYELRANPVAVLHDITSTQPRKPDRAEFLEPALLRMMDRNPDSRWSMPDAAHGLRRLADAHAGERTRENAVGAGPATAVVPVARREPDPEPAPGPSYDDDNDAHDYSRPAYAAPAGRRKGPVYAVLAALALLLVLGGVAYAASLRGDNTSPSDTAGAGGPSNATKPTPQKTPTKHATTRASQPSPSPTPTASSRTPSPSATPKAGGTGLAAERAFLGDYFSKAPGGTDAAWAMLTPGYQGQHPRSSYDGFWRTISSVSVSNVTDAGNGAVEATLAYTKASGGTTTERHRIVLVPSGGSYLIDGDGPA